MYALSPISSTKPIFRGHLAVLKTVLTIFAGLTYGLRPVLKNATIRRMYSSRSQKKKVV